jgi:hypothetical protein
MSAEEVALQLEGTWVDWEDANGVNRCRRLATEQWAHPR